ncbi:protein-S-isoprenylcysteine O-methyltransferase Ste14 [Conyzicola nivalis]|uniref:Protein-S-isoprenylcysteine O-methyltransferase Ste14 n=1 Tax=Conyzicola nivalis TaxID=1477021 RepID=A0ABV2QRW6_9MICO
MAKPSRKDRTRPVELLVLSGVMAVFTGLIVLMSTRDIVLSLIFLGIAFIVVLVILAMLVLAVRPDGEELTDLDEQNHPEGH